MKQLIGAVSVLAIMFPAEALAKPCHSHRRHAVHHRVNDLLGERNTISEIAPAKKHEITIERQAPSQKVEAAEVHLDAGAGRTLRQLLSVDLGAEVDWANERLADSVARGSYHGSRDVIAQKLLADFDFAIFHKDARLRVVVVGLSSQPSPAAGPLAAPVSQAKAPQQAGCKAPAICVTPPQPAKRPNAE